MRKKPASQNAWRRSIDSDVRSCRSDNYKLRDANAGKPGAIVAITPPRAMSTVDVRVYSDPSTVEPGCVMSAPVRLET